MTQTPELKKEARIESTRESVSDSSLAWLPYLLCILPQLLMLAFIPPTFNQIDSATILTSQLGFLVPHWPPLYPEFISTNVHLFGLNDSAIYAIIITQQTLAAAASIYFVGAFKGTIRRSVLALFACIANYFFILSNGIYTEALSTPLFVFFLGAAARLCLLPKTSLDRILFIVTTELTYRNGALHPLRLEINLRRISAAICFVSLILMTLSRHNMFIFACILPCFYLLKALLPQQNERFKPLIISIALGVLALFTVNATNTLECKLIGSDPTPLYGRVGVYRLHELPWDRMPQEEKQRLINNIHRRCPDDLTRMAASIMIRDNNPWKGSYDQIQALVPLFGGKKTADQALNDACKAFFLTPNKYLVVEVQKAVMGYMGESNCSFQGFIDSNKASIERYRNNPATQQDVLKIAMISKIDTKNYERVSSLIDPRTFDGICRYLPMALLAITLSGIGVIVKRVHRESLLFVISLSVSALVFAIISSVVTIFIPRYIVPTNVIAWLTLGIALISFKDSAPSELKG